MILELQSALGVAVRKAVKSELDCELDVVAFQYSPKVELGDLALTAAFDLAKKLRQKPRDIATRLAAALSGIPGVRRAEVAGGGYVNLYLERGAFVRRLQETLMQPGAPAPTRAERVIVEHTSINPNKAAHVGHVRNAVLGDTFVRVLRFRGYEVGVQNYIDDTGVQVADVVVGFQHLEHKSLADVERLAAAAAAAAATSTGPHPRPLSQRERGVSFDYYCWDLYAKVGDFYAATPQNKALQATTLHAIEHGEGETARLAEFIAQRIVDQHLVTMERLDIRYDLLVHESDILRLHFWNRAFELLKQARAIRLEAAGKQAGCWVLAMGTEGAADEAQVDEDKIIVRSNGTVTYTGKDIAYQLWKLGLLERDFHYRRHPHSQTDGHVLWTTTSTEGESGAPAFGHAQQVYNVIDVGQSYPQRVVRAGVAALGYAEGAAGSHHLGYEKVVLSPATARALGYEVAEDDAVVKVSGRKGLGVKADDLIDALVAKARTATLSREPERDAAAIEAAARAIATGALRYFMLRHGRNKIITFDLDEALAFVGETGPYIQNSVVRARSIFAKLEAQGLVRAELVRQALALELDTLLTGDEGDEAWALLVLMARTEDVADQAVRGEEVSLVARHAFTVAQAFHSYIQDPQHSLLRAESDERRAFRALLVDAFVRQMEVLTELLGIPLPDRM
jgi:arginyl-tRNA synthetase